MLLTKPLSFKYLLIALVAVFSTLVAPAKSANEIELDGILIDRTITRFGQDFIYYYGGYWRDLPGTTGFSVTIYETVYPQAGTKLWIDVNQTTVYQTYFGRRQIEMKERADQAMRITIEHVARVKSEVMLGKGEERW
ncbi:curli production assembly/transport protein CsgE [Ferrimonas lipolytica]|uniref:Curli production assembly/transport component CsgE n=1 Tax=Ferrimonas lipolytica TaxID=2724191 RepID=A0A6H1UEX9_9GAMM|nr:curli production assembly/transport protein CsgE [Ferrimonas lipolytica]QIZ77150.1 curli production assembly protein CsgE [Ferrimonas lipolytica]